ncbi:hypothetical protein SLEP1_g29020 [Rubroshorea leprosula]|uniref:Uncharacterized protein n=1 Tax=Rubroshorea leprosula TaxID=152421 RepID=A0AAV5K211_9ROSI|nr:hypothetical protein SLEP1_g29020 [Rubroshorea leprosula]
MQKQLGLAEEEVNKMKERLIAAEEERDRAINILRELKVGGEFSPSKWSTAMTSGKVADVHTELTLVKESLTNASKELKIKEKTIESLRSELRQRKELELKIAEKDCSLRKLRDELNHIKSSETDAINLLSEGMKRIQEMETEIDKGKEAEAKVMDSLAAQTKQFEQTKMSLEESRLEIKSLRQKVKRLEGSVEKNGSDSPRSVRADQALRKTVENLKSELHFAKENLACSQEEERKTFLKMKNLLEENNRLKNELKSATEAEETNKKAMDDLALALQEVAMQSNKAKERLSSTEEDLEVAQGEIEQLKMKQKNTKEKCSEAKKEADKWKNTAERLRQEAEESLMAWNGKETGFVGCIKKAEEERNAAQQENTRLIQALRSGQNLLMKAKEENQKLRDILKQAINEANVAKEAAAIAREENYQLKDAFAQKDAALNFLSQESENLKINEAAAFNNIRELKRLLAEATIKDWKTEDKERGMVSKSPDPIEQYEDADEEHVHQKDDREQEEHKDDKEQAKNKDDKEQEKHKDDKKKERHKDDKDKEQGKHKDEKEQVKKDKLQNSNGKEHRRKLSNTINFNLKDLKITHNKHKEGEEQEHKPAGSIDCDEDDSCDCSDPLKGSIFDTAETPKAETTATHQRKKSSSGCTFTEEGDHMNSEEFDNLDGAHFDETEGDRSTRKKRALLRKFGDLIRGRSFHRRELVE